MRQINTGGHNVNTLLWLDFLHNDRAVQLMFVTKNSQPRSHLRKISLNKFASHHCDGQAQVCENEF